MAIAKEKSNLCKAGVIIELIGQKSSDNFMRTGRANRSKFLENQST